MVYGCRGITRPQGCLRQGELGPLPSPQDLAFTALPGLEPALLQYRQRFPWAANGHQQMGILHCQVVARGQRVGPLLQAAETGIGGGAHSLQQLIAFKQQPGVSWCDASARSYAALAASAS